MHGVLDVGATMRPVTDALDRARADLADGRAWKARDRLTGMLATRRDDDLVDLLAQAHYEMGDLPAAGALWFVTGRRDDRAENAMAAWRERAGNEEARWSSLPGRGSRRRRRVGRARVGRACHLSSYLECGPLECLKCDAVCVSRLVEPAGAS